MDQSAEQMTAEAGMRHTLEQLLNGRNAHMTFADAVADFPMEHINTSPPNVPYTFWHLVEHLRIAQEDILDFITNPDYKAPEWPASYWPAPETTATPDDWQRSVDAFAADQQQLALLVQNPEIDLLAELPHAPGYTYLREFVLVADHNAYHVGELAIQRQVLGLWPGDTSGVL